jgi:DNA-binding SARP family transcriptional activator/basic membrane lipoprotein Med (substrate-binding protein (PBP1-ABC) superfamily)
MQAACNPLESTCRTLATASIRLSRPPVKWFATEVTNDAVEFRVLGPLEVRLGDQSLSLGGAKQRAVLAMLLLRAGEVVPVERLVDEVWGDDPPPSAAHSLEAYVSRIRQMLNGHGPSLLRRGAGYCLALGEAVLDARVFEEKLEVAASAAADGELERASQTTGEALALWRGPALADVSLASVGRAEAERLEERRLRALEQRSDAELDLGRHEALVGELQVLVGRNPYRERFVAQLMLALYRSGRQAEALEIYEQTRRRLGDDLGLQPSADLQQLSGQIVRQEPQLRTVTGASRPPALPRSISHRARRASALVAVGALVAAIMALTASGSAPRLDAASSASSAVRRVALVLPRAPATAPIDDVRVRETAAAFRKHTDGWGHESEVLVADVTGEAIERMTRRIEAGGFALVLVLEDGAIARALAPVVRQLTGTHFVFIDASLAAVSLRGVPNATGMPYADDESSQLMGYLSGLMPPRGGLPETRADRVSIVAAPRTPRLERIARAFTRGVRQARPSIEVRIDYVQDERNKTACEQLANDQIDAGSDVLFAVAGECSSSALEVARIRGVWGIRVNDDGVSDGPHIIATTYKQWHIAVKEALYRFELDTIPQGRDHVLGLADDYAVDAWGSDSVRHPILQSVWSKVVRLCSKIRQHTQADTP